MLFDRLYSVGAKCTDASNVQAAVLLFSKARSQSACILGFGCQTGAKQQAGPIRVGRYGTIEGVCSIRLGRSSYGSHPAGLDLPPVAGERKAALEQSIEQTARG